MEIPGQISAEIDSQETRAPRRFPDNIVQRDVFTTNRT
jgi:hypothetical protein